MGKDGICSHSCIRHIHSYSLFMLHALFYTYIVKLNPWSFRLLRMIFFLMAVLAYTPLEGYIFHIFHISVYMYCCPFSSVGWVIYRSKMAAMQVLSLGKFVRGLRVGELVVGLRPPEATPGWRGCSKTHIFHVFHGMMYNGLVA